MHPRLAKIRRELHEGSIPWNGVESQTISVQQKRLNRFILRYAKDVEDRGDSSRAEDIRKLLIPRFPFADI